MGQVKPNQEYRYQAPSLRTYRPKFSIIRRYTGIVNDEVPVGEPAGELADDINRGASR